MQEYRSYRKRGQSAAPKAITLTPITEIDERSLRVFGAALFARIIEDLEWSEARIAAGNFRIRPNKSDRKSIRDKSKMNLKELDGLEAMCSTLMDNPGLQHWADCAGISLRQFRQEIIKRYPLTYKLATKGM